MSDAFTSRLTLPTLAAGQAQKEVSVNEAFQRLDALVQPAAVSTALSSPPASPSEGACWIVAAGATGAWAGQEDAIAQWTAGGWRYLTSLIHDARFRARSGHLLRLAVLRGRPASLAFVSPHSD